MTLDEAKRRLDEIWDNLFTYHTGEHGQDLNRTDRAPVNPDQGWA